MTKKKQRKARKFYLLTYRDEPSFVFKTKKLAKVHQVSWFGIYEMIKVVEVLKAK